MIKIDNNKGFSLIEILVAMAILSVGLLGTAALTAGIIRGNQVSNRVTTATTLAQDKMEDIKRMGYAGAADDAEDYNAISGYPLYKRTTQVDPATPAAGMKKITVTVYWNSDNSQVELQTILAE